MHQTTTVYLDVTAFDALCEARGWGTDAERARALGLAHSTVSRVRRGEQRPGIRFAHSCTRVFGDAVYSRLFRKEGS